MLFQGTQNLILLSDIWFSFILGKFTSLSDIVSLFLLIRVRINIILLNKLVKASATLKDDILKNTEEASGKGEREIYRKWFIIQKRFFGAHIFKEFLNEKKIEFLQLVFQ